MERMRNLEISEKIIARVAISCPGVDAILIAFSILLKVSFLPTYLSYLGKFIHIFRIIWGSKLFIYYIFHFLSL